MLSFNDHVEILSGSYKGKKGKLIYRFFDKDNGFIWGLKYDDDGPQYSGQFLESNLKKIP